jgi:hypothetical protein
VTTYNYAQNLTKCVHVEQIKMAAAAGALCTLNLFLLRKGGKGEAAAGKESHSSMAAQEKNSLWKQYTLSQFV